MKNSNLYEWNSPTENEEVKLYIDEIIYIYIYKYSLYLIHIKYSYYIIYNLYYIYLYILRVYAIFNIY